MACRIEIVSEVADWLGSLQRSNPLAARLVAEAVSALANKGVSLGWPLVVQLESVWNLPEALDNWYQDRLDRLLEVRRAMAAGGEEGTASHGQTKAMRGDKELRAKHDRMQRNTDMFRARKERLKAGYLAAQAAGQVAEAAEALGEPIPGYKSRGESSSFKVLQPTRIRNRELRIVFVMEPSDTAVLLYGAESEQDQQAWLSEVVPEVLRRYRCRMDGHSRA